VAVLAGSSLTGNLKAQSAWPSKQVRITVPALVANLSYHPLKDFTPVTSLAAVPTVLMMIPSVPAQQLRPAPRDASALPRLHLRR
jgi:hypothetical protein